MSALIVMRFRSHGMVLWVYEQSLYHRAGALRLTPSCPARSFFWYEYKIQLPRHRCVGGGKQSVLRLPQSSLLDLGGKTAGPVRSRLFFFCVRGLDAEPEITC